MYNSILDHSAVLVHDITDEEVWSIVQYVSKKKVNIDLSNLKRLGIDEIALRKGHSHYCRTGQKTGRSVFQIAPFADLGTVWGFDTNAVW